MKKRKIGPFKVEAVGLGCMSLSHSYGIPPSDDDGAKLLNRALDLGYDFFDTASIYGVGHNETLIGKALRARRDEFVLASKCGLRVGNDAARATRFIDGTPAGIAEMLDLSLMRLGIDTIDLYYLHRLDPKVPVEESVGALADAVTAGKMRSIGLSEVSAATLRRAHSVHPIAAVQTEYSLWTRNPEIAVLDACRELGTAFVAFSPVGRGFLADGVRDVAALPKGDLRRNMPRFQSPHLEINLELLAAFKIIAAKISVTPGQLSLAWLLGRDDNIVTIPGTSSIHHLEENFAAGEIVLAPEVMERLDRLINRHSVSGPRYAPAMQASIDTEDFAV